ncbi:hypothetical protein L3X38_029405 [Prunus dulcis]|uniref:Uncharacterized protein n=1 Tax=Prunus dulcis TaxID=3755 RepID=A0AAD4Z2Y5_PRUDU|nr:hypothetical protein L3X38_029405 [Prunus dulcis]
MSHVAGFFVHQKGERSPVALLCLVFSRHPLCLPPLLLNAKRTVILPRYSMTFLCVPNFHEILCYFSSKYIEFLSIQDPFVLRRISFCRIQGPIQFIETIFGSWVHRILFWRLTRLM